MLTLPRFWESIGGRRLAEVTKLYGTCHPGWSVLFPNMVLRATHASISKLFPILQQGALMNSLVHQAGCSQFSELLLPCLSDVKRNRLTRKSHALVIRRTRATGPWNTHSTGSDFISDGRAERASDRPPLANPSAKNWSPAMCRKRPQSGR